MKPTIVDIDDANSPERDEYQRYIDVWFSNGTRIRHVVDQDGRYIEQAFDSNDHDAVWDDFVIEDNVDPTVLDENVMVWLEIVTEELEREETSDWSALMIRENGTASPTNVAYE